MPLDKLDRLLTELHSLRLSLERLRVTLAAHARVADDHETRLRFLEQRQQSLAPLLAALTFLLGVVATELAGRLW